MAISAHPFHRYHRRAWHRFKSPNRLIDNPKASGVGGRERDRSELWKGSCGRRRSVAKSVTDWCPHMRQRPTTGNSRRPSYNRSPIAATRPFMIVRTGEIVPTHSAFASTVDHRFYYNQLAVIIAALGLIVASVVVAADALQYASSPLQPLAYPASSVLTGPTIRNDNECQANGK
jgi:hypothetical protein